MVRLKGHLHDQSRGNVKSFNSKMVRLKGQTGMTYESVLCGFNSKMVRLKVLDLYCGGGGASLFQFQNGSIKSLLTSKLAAFDRGFNSKMVRLKAPSPDSALYQVISFNSKMVRLKVEPVIAPDAFIVGFNSKMVRLKGSLSLEYC